MIRNVRSLVKGVRKSSSLWINARRITMDSESTERSDDLMSDLARIDLDTDDPFVLFKEWQQEAKSFGAILCDVFSLATTSASRNVSVRNLVLRRLDEDGFVFITNSDSRKAHDLAEVPSAGMCFLMAYKNEANEYVNRQVRIEGSILKLDKDDYQELYDREPLYCKIRAHICEQGREVDWDQLKIAHDKLLAEVRSRGESVVSMPDNVVGYKLLPSYMDFYYARSHFIADRLSFRKNPVSGRWEHQRVAA